MKSLQPFFCFYGGKWRAAMRYPAPEHNLIVEPFAGAAGYATRYASADVVLVERDPEIAAMWRFLIRASGTEIRRIPILRLGETTDDLHGCAEEARSLVGFWLNKGSSTPKRSPSAWMRAGIRPNSFWGEAIRERVAAQVDRIRHWTLIEGEYTSAPVRRATWFIDPPYEGPAGRRYRHHDVNYYGLASWCSWRMGQVIVCEGAGAGWLPFKSFASLKANESRTGGKRSLESIYVQRDGLDVTAEAA